MFKAPESPLFILANKLADKDSQSAAAFRQQTCYSHSAQRALISDALGQENP